MDYRNNNEAIATILADGDTSQLADILAELHNEDGIFYVDEGPLHDYKREYPFSSSDSYFAGILRLICAFHNSYGGLLIFGVHDKTRAAGHNKVIVDSEKINRKLRENLSRPITVSVENYDTQSGEVQVLLVPPRKTMSPPVYINKKIADYLPRKVYIRKGAEVLTAKGSDLQFLYGQRSSAFLEMEDSSTAVPSSLPASPATIQEFVGRFRAIEKIVEWFEKSRDPRMFLWGQGGSGKSTIAYEAAVLFSENGRLLTNRLEKSLDRVLFVSGKSSLLNPTSGKIEEIRTRDFSDGLDLFRSILIQSGWSNAEEIETYDQDKALDALDQLFEIETVLIVIDDIDTLTTSGVDAGMEELFLCLSRAQSGSKILYTQRNFPSFAPNAALEVPGLKGGDFNQFLELCCLKYSVQPPTAKELQWIEEQSEGRPLAIETIIGMRRVTSSYSEAFERWKQHSTEAREYLFRREYQQLGHDDRARHLLAALSIFDKPQSFDALKDVLQFSSEQLQDAIAETRDMFLRVSVGLASKGDTYSIGPATKLFISEVSNQLDRYSSILARTHLFNSSAKKSPAAYVPYINRARSSIKGGNPKDAVSLLRQSTFPAAFHEHPEVKATLGQAYANLPVPNVDEARACFESAFTLGHTDYKMYLDWLELERKNRTEITNGIKICEKVLNSDEFSSKTHVVFWAKLARLQMLKSKELSMASPNESLRLRTEVLISNFNAFTGAVKIGDRNILAFRERTDDSLSIALRMALKEDDFDRFFDTAEALLGAQGCADEFAETLASRLLEIRRRNPADWRPLLARLNRFKNFITKIPATNFSSESKALTKETVKVLTQTAK